MSDTDLKLTITAETGQAVAAVGTLDKKLDETGQSAQEAGEKGKALAGIGDAAKHSADDLARVQEASKGLVDAFSKLDGSTASVDRAQKALDHMRQAAEQAGLASKEMAGQIGAAQAKLDEMRGGTDRLNTALAKIDTAGPRRLGAAAAEAQLALDAEREAAEKAGTATAEMGARFDQAQKKIDAAAVTSGKFKDALGDLKTRGDLASRGMESAAASAGSLEGMLGKLKDTGTGTQQELADIGFAAIGMGAAFMAGYSAGEKLDEGLKKLGIDFTKIGTQVIEFSVNFGKANDKQLDFARNAANALGPAIDGIGKLSAATLKMIPAPVISAMRSWLDLTALFKPDAELASTAATRLGAAIIATAEAASQAGDRLKGLGFDVKGAVGHFAELQNAGKDLVKFLDHEMKKGQDDFARSIKGSTPAILALRDAWFASGKGMDEMEPKWKLITLAAEQNADAVDKVTKREAALREGRKDTVSSIESIATAYHKANDAAVKSAESGLKFSKALEEGTRQAINALADYARQNGLTEKDVLSLLDAQKKIAEQTGRETTGLEMLIDAIKRLGLTSRQAAQDQTEFGKQLEKLPALAKYIEDGVKKWDEYRKIQISAATDAQKPIGQLVDAYNKLNAAQEAAFKAGDSEKVETTRKQMAANLVAQAGAANRLAEEASNANIALGALNRETVEGVKGMEALITQTLAVRAAQEQLNAAWRDGQFQLQGIAWETRKATEKTVELSEAQQQLIEELAKLSDANPSTQLWFGHMVYQLEEDMKKGKGSIEEFQAAVQKLFQSLRELSASAPMYVGLQELETQLYRIMALLEGARGNGPFPGSPHIPQR
ncbi:MAG: hypothetical protein IT186_15960 [Acidobacteria bacterium]|nr:hypothetical protein [Acidobacteriota bacterium]